MKRKITFFLSLLLFVRCYPTFAEIKRVKYTDAKQYLIIEILDDDLVHLELSAKTSGPNTTEPIYTSPMIDKSDYGGPSFFSHLGTVLETSEMRLSIDPASMCISFSDKVEHSLLTTICPLDLDHDWKGLTLSRERMENVYGLGQQFRRLGSADGDWLSHEVREEQPQGQEQAHGNGFMPFGPAGMVGNVQFPIMYALGSSNLNYALFLDNVYKQRWDFKSNPWKVQMWGDQIRFYVMTGRDLLDLRKDYLELVGRPPVPPRKAFGLWVSEFGYKNWLEIDSLRSSLRQDNFPVDGFVLDLQWFGGIIANSPDSPMGRLDWDQDMNDGNEYYFPDPAQKIADLANDHIGLINIEESYINEHTATFSQMSGAGDFFAYSRADNRCNPSNQSRPVIITNWFGKAAMVDWSDRQAGIWVHDQRRFPNLIEKGILGHWTDLGEPEKYDPRACYEGVEVTASGLKNQHGDVHNLYNFLWNQSIYDGYVRMRAQASRRPLVLSRSGAPGSQRFGVMMWSGDIGSHLDLLATHLNSQMHMSFSGIDYYGSDIGGFRREGMPYNSGHAGNLQYQNELYTQWLANGAWFDVPVRPHTDNSFQKSIRYETAPNLVGKKEVNLANVMQRYELIPYYYSLAYRAYLFGEPVIAPLVLYYQDDPHVRLMGHEKLIGKDVLVGVVARHGEYQQDIYLPKGKWVNYHSNEWVDSRGDWLRLFPTYIDGILRLPCFVRAGAIIPIMPVDKQTMDSFGHRKDGTSRDDLIVKVYSSAEETRFTLYEDDGTTIGYDSSQKPQYQTRTTEISQKKTANVVKVVIKKANGSYNGARDRRNNIVKLFVDGAKARRVTLDGISLAEFTSETEFNSSTSGWYNGGDNLILAKSGVKEVDADKEFSFWIETLLPSASAHFVCDNGWTNSGENIYVVGDTSVLGNWDVNSAVKLDPNIYYEYIYNPPPGHNGPGPSTPKWTGYIRDLPASTAIEWKCVKKLNSGEWQWEPGSNNIFITPTSGFGGTSIGSF